MKNVFKIFSYDDHDILAKRIATERHMEIRFEIISASGIEAKTQKVFRDEPLALKYWNSLCEPFVWDETKLLRAQLEQMVRDKYEEDQAA